MMTPPSTEEKFWAVLAHLSALFSGTGMALPSFAWAEGWGKSKYVTFHTLQAFAYQSLGYGLWAIAALLVLIVQSIVTYPLLNQGEGLGLWLASHALVTLVLYGLYLLVPISGAILCLLGRDFRYPLMGGRLARYIGYHPAAQDDTPLDEHNQERTAAAMGHFAVVYPLWGMLPSLLFLIILGGRSRYLKFHSLQTIVFQAFSTLVTFVLGALDLVVLVISMVPVMLQLQTGAPLDMPPIESLIGFFVFLICLIITLLIVPLYQIIGQWAGLMILLGREYRYPLIGRWVEHWLSRREAASRGVEKVS